ncbi:hypothetical protein RQP46_006275 [Phenoliferia psychrophenolica]
MSIKSLEPYLEDPTTSPRVDQGRADPDAAAERSDQGVGEPSESKADTELVMTSRFEHAVAEDGGTIILTGRGGVLERCEDEPIHVPGAIQAFGVLIAFDETPTGELVVQQVSENSRFIIGIPPTALIRAPSLTTFLSPDEQDVLLEALESLSERDSDPLNTEVGPMNFILSGEGLPGTGDGSAGSSDRQQWTCHCGVHRPDPKNPQRTVLEMELVEDPINPRRTDNQELDEKGGMSRGGDEEDEGEPEEPSWEDLEKSTVNLAQPLRALQRYKKRAARGGKKEEMDIVGLLAQINEQLSKAEELEEFLQITAGIFKELTEFDRVMIYQFDENWNGRVVAEQVDWSKTKDLFRGLNFPASDIPAQARELYKVNKVRLLYDRDQPTARMCCRSLEEVENPLNMTHCYLRAMSPIHIKYLGNMGVRSSMSISITAFGDLWGLIALHTYGRFGQRVAFPVRELCKLLGDSISRNIERLSYAKRLHARKLINTNPTSANPSGYIVAKAEDLLTLFDADFGVLSIGDEAKILGAVANSQELLAILDYFRLKQFVQMQTSQDIRSDFPDIDYPSGFELVAGLLSVPLSSEGKDFIVFFRRGQLQEVHWAGNPYAAKTQSWDGKSLDPRKSFKTWSETVVGKCRVWSDEQLETAGVLCLVYGKFIDVWRQKESALAANQLTNLLLANASHEVRTPLNAIIKFEPSLRALAAIVLTPFPNSYLELALDGPVDGEVRENLARSHAASRSLIHVINDLLDLTRTEKGNDLFLQDPFDLPSTIIEATQIHKAEALRRGLTLDVVESPSGTPPIVVGDRGKIRQIVNNVVGNAVKHTNTGGIMIEWGELVDANVEDALDARKDSIRIGISITDTGVGISEARLESLFREFEQVSTADVSELAVLAPTVGLGLAVVARIVRNLGGQLRVDSKVDEGTKFTFVLPFRLPSIEVLEPRRGSTDQNAVEEGQRSGSSGRTVSARTYSSLSSDKVHLSSGLSRTMSNGSGDSNSAKSDIDSLINAMTSSHMDPHPHRKKADHSPSVSSAGSSSRATNRSWKTAASSQRNSVPGQINIEDTGVPLRPVRVAPPMESPSSNAARRPSFEWPEPSAPALVRSSFDSSIRTQRSPPEEAQLSPASPVKAHIDLPPADPLLVDGIDSPPEEVLGAVGSLRHLSEYRAAKPVAEQPAVPPAPETHMRMRVLVVEDELINRMIIEKRLKKEGHDVVTAEHGGDALRLLGKDTKFDIVLMDLSMPIVNGFDCSLGIRELEGEFRLPGPDEVPRPSTLLNGRLPILAVSASLHERQREQLIESTIDGWLLKPVDFKRLYTLMRGAVDNAQRDLDVYKPGSWEQGGWLNKAPGTPLSPNSHKRRFASAP